MTKGMVVDKKKVDHAWKRKAYRCRSTFHSDTLCQLLPADRAGAPKAVWATTFLFDFSIDGK